MRPPGGQTKGQRDQTVHQSYRRGDKKLHPAWPIVHYRPLSVPTYINEERTQVSGADLDHAKGCEEAGQLIWAEDHVAVPQRTSQALPDSPLNSLEVRDYDHQPAARLDQPQVFCNQRARVIEMLDESRGIYKVECFRRERGHEKVLTDDASRHALQSEIGAQQLASAPGEVSAE